MRPTNDTYPLNPDFPFHMNRLWLGAHHHAKEHFHWHSFYEISCVLSGEACCFADGRLFLMNPGDIAVFNADEIHGWRMKDDIELLVLTFSPELIASSPNSFDSGYLQLFKNHTPFQNRLGGSDMNTALLRTIMKEAFKEWQSNNLGRNLMLKSQLLHILVLLIRYFQAPENENGSLAHSRKKENLKAAVSFIDSHYKEPVTLKDAAAAACMSPNYFSACFRQVFGENFKQYLNRLRLSAVHEALLGSDNSVLDIAISCGFRNMSNFYEQYKKLYGCLPRRSEANPAVKKSEI